MMCCRRSQPLGWDEWRHPSHPGCLTLSMFALCSHFVEHCSRMLTVEPGVPMVCLSCPIGQGQFTRKQRWVRTYPSVITVL